MKNKILKTLGFLATVLFLIVACNGDEENISNYDDLKVENTSLMLKGGEVKIVNIISGSGSYQVDFADKNNGIVEVGIKEGKKEYFVKGIKEGVEQLVVKDVKSKQTQLLQITVKGGVNMSRYIKLNVKKNEKIKIGLLALKDDTSVQIVSGDRVYNEKIGTGLFTENKNYTTGADTMIIYGDVKTITCSFNKDKITGIDVSNNTSLVHLFADDNSIKSLDVRKNVNLEHLWCAMNTIKELDVSNNTRLKILWCPSNLLASLDVSTNIHLTQLNCGQNQIVSLDVSSNKKLKVLACGSNKLKQLDVTKNKILRDLYCENNQIASLDVSQNKELKLIECQMNKIENLDISFNKRLVSLACQDNDLQSLNVANGNNANIVKMWVYNNPNLSCVQYDEGFNPEDKDCNYSENKGWCRDGSTKWCTDCENQVNCQN